MTTTDSDNETVGPESLVSETPTEIGSRRRVGLIGAGLLGNSIAERLIRAGHAVLGFDLSEACNARLEAIGGQIASSAASVFRDSHVVFLSLPDSHIVRQLIDEVAESLDAHTVIDTTTGAPQSSRTLGKFLAARGVEYLDATVVGSSEQARQGDVVTLVGGELHAFEQARPYLQAFSTQQFHTGPCGSGAMTKLIVNLVLGLNRAVLAEGLNLARHCDVDLNQMLTILRSGAAYSRAMDVKGQKMIDEDFSPQARLDQHAKDVRLILELGQQNAAALPLCEAHQRLLELASDLGLGSSDNSAVIRAFDALQGYRDA